MNRHPHLIASALILTSILTIALSGVICQRQLNIKILRTIDAKSSYTLIVDEIEIESGYISNFTYYIPLIYLQKMYSISAFTERGEELTITLHKTTNFTYKMIVKLPNYTTPFKFKVKMCMIKVITPTGPTEVKLAVPLYPSTDINITQCKAIVKLPPDMITLTLIVPNTTTTKIDGRDVAEYMKTPLPAKTNTTFIASFSIAGHQIRFSKLNRKVEFNGAVKILDELIITNEGLRDIASNTGFKLTLPLSTKITSVRDDFGSIGYEVKTENESTILTIKPRINIKKDWKYRVFIEYELMREEWITNGKVISVPIDPFYDYPIDQYIITMKIEEGGEILSYSGVKPKYFSKQYATYEFTNFTRTYYSGLKAKLEFKAPPSRFEIPTYIITYTIIGAIIGATIYLRRTIKRAPPVLVEEKVLISNIKDLQETYAEKIGILLDTIRIEESWRRKKISRKIYRARSRELSIELSRCNSKLSELKSKISEKSNKLKKAILELEKTEKELEEAAKGLIYLEREYSARRITRRTYEDMKRRREKELRKARAKLERRLAELSEII